MVFTDYNTKFLDEEGVNHLIKELKEYMSGLATGDVDLSAYVTKEELQAKLDALDIKIDLSSYATKEELEQAISGIDLSSYALKTDIPTVPSLDGYATTEYVDNAIANIPTNDGASDLTNYYTKEEVYNKEEVDSLVANSGGSSSSNGGTTTGGITYAYETEIATGETWIDGKPIYMKVFHVDALEKAPSSAISYSSYHSQDKFAETIVSINTTWVRNNYYTSGNSVISPSAVNTSASSVGANVNDYIIAKELWVTISNNTNFYIQIGRGKSNYAYACDVFVKYTKL